jgi:hypothetical protein
MKRSAIETIMGAVVLLVAGLFLVFAYQSTDLRLGSSYQLTARFNADGDRIERTEDAIALEELLGKVMFLVTGEEVE